MNEELVRSQKEHILEHMDQYGGITSKIAMDDYGIGRLASRISELKKSGYEIHAIWETGLNRYGKKIRWKKYRLGREEDYDTI